MWHTQGSIAPFCLPPPPPLRFSSRLDRSTRLDPRGVEMPGIYMLLVIQGRKVGLTESELLGE